MNLRRLCLGLAAAVAATLALAVLPADPAATNAVASQAGAPDAARLVLSQNVSAAAARDASCIDRLQGGSPGVVTRRASGPVEGGILTARLKASGGDWDLAIFDERTGLPLAQAAGFGADEVAEGFVGVNRSVIVQACRRRGNAGTAAVQLFSTAIPGNPAAEPLSMVTVDTPTHAAKNRLTALGLDVTEHGDEDSVDVVLHGAADAATLRDAGFSFTTEVADLMAQDRADRAQDRRYARDVQRSNLPSGRDGYRRLGEINEEMKTLASQHPDLVKPITLKNKSLEGRDVHGIEVAANVNREDGRPVFVQMGVHHAREWPSVEMPMEFANDLIKGFGNNPRVTDLLQRTRVIFVPVVNVDGYNLSREAPVDLAGPAFAFDGAVEDSCDLGNATTGVCLGYSAALLADPSFAYKRRNCRTRDGANPAPGECGLQASRQLGTDPNRNYGALWGGPGASPLPNNDTYRGAGPFSEPETQNIQHLVSTRQVVTLITNHTFSNLILRPPGVKAQGAPPEDPLLSALGKAMSDQNGYTNQAGYELYDTTGTTEDWSYNATGGFGYTFEIGPEQFHPPYAQVVEEYLGKPGTPSEGKGNREAYFKALEHTADATKHAQIRGRAPAGAVLRLSKEFDTSTSPVVSAIGGPGPVRTFRDKLETTSIAPGGDFTIHANPSTRPSRMQRRKVGTAAEKPFRSRSIGQSRQTKPGIKNPVESQIPFLFPDYTPENYEDIPFEIKPEDEVALLRIVVTMEEDDDYDIVLYKKNGRDPVPDVDDDDDAGNVAGEDEIVQIVEPPIGEYVLRVNNYDASSPWLGTINEHKAGSAEILGGSPEEWTMRCERANGDVLGATKVQVDRGATADVGNLCNAAAEPSNTIALAGGDAGLRFAVQLDRRRLRRAVRLGIRGRVRCTTSCRPRLALVVSKRTARRYGLRSRVVARGSHRKAFSGRRTFTVRFTRDAKRKLRRARTVRMSLVAVVLDRKGKRLTARRGFRLR
jgi:hypothetical protein